MPRILYAVLAAALMTLLPIEASFAQAENAPTAAPTGEQATGKAPKAPPTPEEIEELLQKSAQAYEDGNWVRFYSANRRLNLARPHVPEYPYNIVLAASEMDRKTTAYHFMLELQKQGLSYDFNQSEHTQNIRGTEAYDYINNLMIEAGQPAGEASRAFTLPGAPGDYTDITWDARNERFLVGTRKEGRVLAVMPDGSTTELLKANDANGLWSVTGLAVDADNNRLWITSTATPAFAAYSPADRNRGAVFEYTLDTLEQVARYNLPVDGLDHELGRMAVTADGGVYVIDRANPIVFHKAADGDRLEPFMGSRALVQLTDIAVTPDNSRLFAADAVMGILLVDPNVKRSALLAGPENLNQGGIHGLEFHDGHLLIVQSEYNPQRVLRLKLDAAGAGVESVTPMAIALDGFDRPGASVVSGGQLVYFANQGTQAGADELLAMATPLDAGSEVKPPDMRHFEKALRAQQQQ